MSRVPVVVKRSYSRTAFILITISFAIFWLSDILSVSQYAAASRCDASCESHMHDSWQGILVLGFCLLIAPFWWRSDIRFDAKRQSIASGDSARFSQATPQPEPIEQHFNLPLTLQSATTLRSLFTLVGIYWLSVLVIGFTSATFFYNIRSLDAWLLAFGIAVPSFIIFFAFLLVVGRKRIDITQDGITIRAYTRKQTVRWEEAKLFSYPRLMIAETKHRWLELASHEAIVRWSYVNGTQKWFITFSPTMSIDEYNRVIDALNAYVVARTGLTLYDLRS